MEKGKRKRGAVEDFESAEIAKQYITHLATGLIFPSIQKVFDLMKEGDFERAYWLFTAFIALHPADVRKDVLGIDEEAAKAEAKKEVEEIYGRPFEDILMETVYAAAAMREFRQRFFKHKLLVALERLGDAWEKHGLVWFGAGYAGI